MVDYTSSLRSSKLVKERLGLGFKYFDIISFIALTFLAIRTQDIFFKPLGISVIFLIFAYWFGQNEKSKNSLLDLSGANFEDSSVYWLIHTAMFASRMMMVVMMVCFADIFLALASDEYAKEVKLPWLWWCVKTTRMILQIYVCHRAILVASLWPWMIRREDS